MSSELSIRGGATSPALSGRHQELQRMRSALALARGGHGQVVVVSGEAGTGKSRLLGELAELARQSGASTLRGRCSVTGQAIPFELAHQLIEPISAEGPAAELATQLVMSGIPSATPPGQVIHALHVAAVAHARRQPCLIAVDDLEFADSSSQRFLAHLIDRMEDLPLVLAVGLTDEGALVPELAASLLGGGAITRLALLPLDRDSVAETVRNTVGWDDEALHEVVGQRTAGYPGLIQDLLAEAASRLDTPPSADDLRKLVPDALVRSVSVAFARLEAPARDLAGALAVLEEDVPPDVVVASAKLSEAEFATAAGQLLQAGLAWSAEAPAQRRLTLRAPLVRDALLRALGSEQVASTRLKVAFAIGGAVPATAAKLLLAGPPTGRQEAAGLLRSAADQALSSGNAPLAGRLLRRALREPIADPVRSEVELELAVADAVAGRIEAVVEHDRLLAGLTDPQARAAALQRLADARLAGDDRRRAAECYLRALSELSGVGTEEDRRRLEIRYAAATLQLSELGHRSRERLVEQLARGDVAFSPAFAVRLAIDRVAAAAPVSHALHLAEWATEQGLLTDPDASDFIPTLISVLLACDEINDAKALIRWVLESQLYAMPVKAAVLTEQAKAQLYQGQLDAAAASARNALEHIAPAAAEARAAAQGTLVRILVKQGNLAEATNVLSTGTTEHPDPESSLPLVLAEGWLGLGCGDVEWALERFVEARKLMQAAGIVNPALCDAESGAVVSLLRLDRTLEAADLARDLLERARSFGAPRTLAASLRAAARVSELERAEPLLAEALRLLEGTAFELELARCRVAYGATLRRLNRRADAREHLRLALDAAHRLGARQLLQRARTELLATGARPRRPAITGRNALTPAERRVADLAAKGHGNRKIADDLFITVKTVEWHLHNVFIKLGVRSRAELRNAIQDADAEASGYLDGSPRRAAG